MHGYVDAADFLEDVSVFLGCYYLVVALMNGIAAFYLWKTGRAAAYCQLGRWSLTSSHLWLLVAALFTAMAIVVLIALTGRPELMKLVSMPESVKAFLDHLLTPTRFYVGLLLVSIVLFAARRFFARPAIAWSTLNLALLFMGLSVTDPDFAKIVGKPDNVAIVGMVFLLGFFVWLGTHLAVRNDERLARGEPPNEALQSEKVLVWPDLVYIELICMVALTALLILWSIGLKAPLEQPASVVSTPNPSKAPWYFVGLQEMLLYYEPWMAGVVLPGLIIFGLMAIPYLDVNEKGNGYYTINQRKFSYLTFQFGFLMLWITLIVMGTFMRGPNWTFFGLYETWDPHKVQAAKNVSLSEYVWVWQLGMARPSVPEVAGVGSRLLSIVWRESPGIILLGIYFGLVPLAMVTCSKFFRQMYKKMGFMRFTVMVFLLLVMGLLPIKMIAWWTIDLNYFVSIPEYSLNF